MASDSLLALPGPDRGLNNGNGWPAEEVFAPPQGHSMDEVVFVPGVVSSAKAPVDLTTKITRNFELRYPLVTGPNELVTEANMAIAMAMEGGVGIIHGNQSIEDQVAMVRQVKMYQTGFILHCETLKPWSTVGEAQFMQAERGCSGLPVTDNGRVGGRLVGIVTRRDVDSVEDKKLQVKAVMTSDVCYVREPVAIKQAREVMAQAKVSKLPIVNKDKELVALLCRGDLKREREHPTASRDANRSLVVSGAVNCSREDAYDRVQALVEAGVDFLCIDTDDGVFPDTIHFIKRIKDMYEGLDLLAGRVRSVRQAKNLCDAGVDGVRMGTDNANEASTLYHIAKLVREGYQGVPVLADISAKNVDVLLKAFCLGAATVTLDFSDCDEAPGDHFYHEGVRVRLRNSEAFGERQVQVGTRGGTVLKGSVASSFARSIEALRVAMRELGLESLGDVGPSLASGALRLERRIPRGPEELEPRLHAVAPGGLHNRW